MKCDPKTDDAANVHNRVLLVEDEVLIRMDVADTLRTRGWHVVEAGTVRDALDALASSQFDVVLTDVHMPGGLTGVDLARIVKREKSSVAVVVMSGLHKPAIDEGDLFDAFLTKPAFRIAEVLKQVLESKRR